MPFMKYLFGQKSHLAMTLAGASWKDNQDIWIGKQGRNVRVKSACFVIFREQITIMSDSLYIFT